MGDAPRGTILLVDDDAPGRYLTGRLLREAGYEVREAANSSEALAAVALAPPDLVLLDIRLPTLGGAAVLSRIKANPATAIIPVVYLSGSFADDDSIAAGLDEGADAYLIKPISPSVLLATAKALLRMGQVQKQLQATNRRLQTLLDTLPVGVAIAEDPECRTITANAAGAKLFEVEPGRNVSPSMPQEAPNHRYLHAGRELSPEEMPMQRAVATGREVRDLEIEGVMESGHRWMARCNSAPIRDEAGRTVGGVTVLTEITDLKQAEEELRASEERYRRLFETMQEGIQLCEIITDAQGTPVDFRYLEMNTVAARILGHTPEELIGRTRNEVLREPDPKWAALYGEVARTGRPASAEMYALALGRWFEVHVYSPRPGQFASIITDVTERRQAEKEREQLLAELRRQQAFLDTVVARLPAGVVIAEAPGAKVILGNEEMARIWRRPVPAYDSAGEYEGLQGYHPDGRRYVAEEWPLVRAIQKGEAVANEEISIIRGDGSRGTLLSSASPIRDDAGKVIAGVVVSSDITDLVRVQRELERRTQEAEEGKAILDALMEHVPEGLTIADADGRIIMTSRYGLDLSGRSSEEVIGAQIEEPPCMRVLRTDGVTPVPPDELPLVRAVREGEVVTNEECVLQRRDGRRSPFLCTAGPIRDQSGNITGGIITWRDIADLKALEERRLAAERARAELAEDLSDEIAHRVKNNLAMVSGLLQMQLLGQRDPEVAVALREAITRVRAFVSIHEQMYSESGPVDLLITLRSIANNIKEVFAARKDVAISVTGGGLLCASRVATNLSVVANELLINALKHGSPGADGQLRVLLSVTSDDGCVVIAVWNSGRPVAADFDVAQRRNMGLRVVLDVVHGYGGTFALQPDGAGTRAEAVLNLEELSSTH